MQNYIVPLAIVIVLGTPNGGGALLSRAIAQGQPTALRPEMTVGVPPGTRLTGYVGTLHIKSDNTVVDGLRIVGDIVVDAKNVTIRNTKLTASTWHAVRIMEDAVGFTLMDSEIDGGGKTDNGVYGFGTILRTDIHDVENGMTIWGPSVIEGNHIHDLRNSKDDPHFDGVQINGGQDIWIRNNVIVNNHNQTSAIIMGNTFGGLSNIAIEGNRLAGGGYTVYLDDRKGGGAVDDSTISIVGNEIFPGRYGEFSLYGSRPIIHSNISLDELAPAETSTVQEKAGPAR